jgi:hypothetical protein
VKAANKPLDGIVSALSELRFANFDRLEEVSIVGTSLSDENLEKFSKLPELRRLVLDDNPIRGPGLVHLQALPALVDLSLNCPTITDLLAKNLAELKQLKRLSLVGANLSDWLARRTISIETDPHQFIWWVNQIHSFCAPWGASIGRSRGACRIFFTRPARGWGSIRRETANKFRRISSTTFLSKTPVRCACHARTARPAHDGWVCIWS